MTSATEQPAAGKPRRGFLSKKVMAGLAATALSVVGALTSLAGQKIYIYSAGGTALAGWNKISLYNSHQPRLAKALVDSENQPTGVSLFLMTPAVAYYGNSTGAFIGEAAEFEVARSESGGLASCSTDPTKDDSGLAADFRGYHEENIRGRFEGLNPDKLYEFTFVGQRNTGSEDMSTRYTVIGVNTASSVLNTAKNTTKVARLSCIAPRPDGSVEFTVAAAESNTYWMRFGYINAIKVEEMDAAVGAEDIFISVCKDPDNPSAVNTWNYLKCASNFSDHNCWLMKNAAGEPTGVSISSSGWATENTGGVTTPYTGDAAEFEELRNGGSKFLYVANSAVLTLTVRGLLPDAAYDFTLLPSRPANWSTTTCCDTTCTVTGLNSGSGTVNAQQNFTKVVKVDGIKAKADGTVTIAVSAGSANNSGYFNLVGLKIHRQPFYREGDRRVEVNATAGGSVSAIVDADGSIPDEDIFISTCKDPDNLYAVNFWNRLKCTSSGNTCSAKNAAGEATGVSISNSGSGAENTGGVTTPYTGDAAEFEELRNGGSQFIYINAAKMTLTVRGLYPETTYDFTLLPSRPASWSKTTCWNTTCTVTGENSGGGTVDAQQNFTKVVKVEGIRPKADGTVTIDVAKGGGNNSGYYALTGLKIHRHGFRLPSSNGRYLGANDTMEVAATPSAGYRFVGWTSSWTDDMVKDNPLKVTGEKHAVWTAVFEKEGDYTAKTVYFDVYGTPSDAAKTWNTLPESWYRYNQVRGGFRASDGSSSSIGIKAIRAWGLYPDGGKPLNGDNSRPFTGDLADFEPARADHWNLWMQIGWTGSVENRAFVAYEICGLRPGRKYRFRFAAARHGAGDNREGIFRCVGENTVNAVVNAAGNTSKAAVCDGVVADANGVIRLDIMPSARNDNGNRFFHLVAFSVEGEVDELPGKRILWFGNSFSALGDIPGRVASLAELAGYDRPVITFESAGGQDTAYHLALAKADPSKSVESKEIAFGCANWDDVVIQGRSREMTTMGDNQGLPPDEGFLPNVVSLFDLVRKSAHGDENTRAVIYEPWAFGRGYAADDFAGYGQPGCFTGPSAMQSQVNSSCKRLRGLIRRAYGQGSAVLARVGEAYEADGFSPDLYDADLFHQGGKYGYELLAVMLFNRIYDTDVAGRVTYAQALAAGVTSLSEDEWNRLVSLARVQPGMAAFVK